MARFRLFPKLFPGRNGGRAGLPFPRPRGGVDGGGGGGSAPNPISLVEDEDSGEMLGVDAFGAVYPITQTRRDLVGDDYGDDFGDDEFGDDLGDDFGDDLGDEFGDDLGDELGDEFGDDDDDDDGEDDMDFGDDLMGDDFGDDVLGDDVMGAAGPGLQRRIQRLTNRINKIASKPTPRGLFWRKRAAKRIRVLKRLRSKRAQLARMLRGGRNERRGTTAALLAAAGLGVGGGALGAAFGRQRLNNVLAPSRALLDPMEAQAVRRQMAAAGVRYDVNAPPPSGQLNALPMFPFDDLTNPRNAITVPIAGVSASLGLRTRDLPFAVVMITGFTASQKGTASGNGAIGLVRNFTIEGGTNLFLSNGWQPADNFDTSYEMSAGGIRNKPVVRSPNYASVEVAASGEVDDVVILVCNTIVDTLQDDVYGIGLTGATTG